MHILHIVGTRPQLVKLAVVHCALDEAGVGRQSIVDTGQHFDPAMSQIFFTELDIPRPDFDLGIHSLPHGAMIGRTLEQLEQLLIARQPDQVLIYGDTNATAAGALAAARLLVPTGHVEAGLRSFNRRGPEEQNRLIADALCDRLYAPTPAAVANLLREGFASDRVVQTGDVMFDCALRFGERAARQSSILDRLGLTPEGFALCTAHRAETTDNPSSLMHLFAELNRLSAQLPVVLPLHPRTRAKINLLGTQLWHPELRLIDPLGYLDMTRLEAAAAVILTDSGGVQREAFFHRRPAVVFRRHSEWVELIEAGWSVLAPLESAPALAEIALGRIGTRGTPVAAFGEGHAATVIASDLLKSC